MEANGGQIHDLMNDVKAVDWLPLDEAVERLSRGYERAFLANVGPLALETASLSQVARRPRLKQPVLERRRGQPAAAPRASLTKPISVPLQPDLTSTAMGGNEHVVVAIDVVEAELPVATPFVETEPAAPLAEREAQGRRKSVIWKVREWLLRVI